MDSYKQLYTQGAGPTELALNTLNEKEYIDKLYGKNANSEKKLIQENYTENLGILNNEQSRVQQQNQNNVNRTQVESNSGTQNVYNGGIQSIGSAPQASLTQENAVRRNTGQLNRGLETAEMEIQRQRQLLASQYETEIKKAQADNDMERAQALYEAAKREDQQLYDTLMKQAEMYSSMGNAPVYENTLKQLSEELPTATFSGTTTDDVLRYEDEIQKIYEGKQESAQLGLQDQLMQTLSDIRARQEAQERQTDEKLTETYVDALQKAKNYAEVQNAYGMGSGSFDQAQLAQDTELQNALTDLRLLQLDADAKAGIQRLDAYRDYGKNLQQKNATLNLEQAKEMLAAAEDQEAKKMEIAEKLLQYQMMHARRDGVGGGGGSSSSSKSTKPKSDPVAENQAAYEAAHNLGLAQKWQNDLRLR